jgi:hypothetical protein
MDIIRCFLPVDFVASEVGELMRVEVQASN